MADAPTGICCATSETTDPLRSDGLVWVSCLETLAEVPKKGLILLDEPNGADREGPENIWGDSEPCSTGPFGCLPAPGQAPQHLPYIIT